MTVNTIEAPAGIQTNADAHSPDAGSAAEGHPAVPASLSPDNPLEAVRNLLFGQEVARMDKRAAEGERRLTMELGHLSDRLSRRLDDLEARMRQGLDDLRSALDGERRDRSAQDDRLLQLSSQVDARLSERSAALSADIERKSREMLEQLQSRAATLAAELTAAREEWHRSLEQRFSALDDATVKNAALGELFVHMGLKLKPQQS